MYSIIVGRAGRGGRGRGGKASRFRVMFGEGRKKCEMVYEYEYTAREDSCSVSWLSDWMEEDRVC